MSNEENGSSIDPGVNRDNRRAKSVNLKKNDQDSGSKSTKLRRNRNFKAGTRAKTKTKDRSPTSEPKFLEISSLVKAFKPITINGSPAKHIITQIRDLTKEQPRYFDRYKNPERLSYLQKYFLEFVRLHQQSTIYLSFIIKPSDPDFPFELDVLKINLAIPCDYPQSPPKIVILNDDIPRGFAMNIEIGFNKIVKLALTHEPQDIAGETIELVDGNSLKSQILTLDRYLENCLKLEKKETIKFVTLKSKKKKSSEAAQSKSSSSKPEHQPSDHKSSTQTPPIATHIPLEVLSQRNQLVENMVNKLPVRLFKKSIHENQYKLTIPRKIGNHNQIDFMIKIPRNYPEQNVTIKFLEPDLVKYETNINSNISHYDFESIDLIVILNKLVNNLGQFVLPKDQFAHWQKLVHSLRQNISI